MIHVITQNNLARIRKWIRISDKVLLSLLLKTAYVLDKRFDLRFRQLLAKSRHASFSVVNRVRDPFVAYAILPLGVSQVARAGHLGLEPRCASVFPVTLGAVVRKKFSRARSYFRRCS